MIFQSLLTSKLSKKKLNEILRLKNSHWNKGIESQKKWFKNNAKNHDYHNIMMLNNNVIGYTFIAKRKLKIKISNKREKTNNYLLFQTLIIKKNYRNFVNLRKFMNFNNKIIIKLKKVSFLLCKKNKIKMYKFFKWKVLKKNNYKVPDHKHNLTGMFFNAKLFSESKNKKFSFYYYS